MNSMSPLFRQPSGLKPRYYQTEALEATKQFLMHGTGNGVVVLPTGCHAAGTLILMHDGSVRPVEAVRVGDRLMGPDSLPRTVLALARGREPMRRVIPVRGGEPFVVNASHIMPMTSRHGITKNIRISEWQRKSIKWKNEYWITNINHGNTQFHTEDLPEDNFYGFTLDGDHLYLDAQGFIHHNTGKALFLCMLCQWAMEDSEGRARIFILTHSKELVQQNAEEMLGLWPNAPIGIYSAGLNQRNTTANLIFGSIQSVHRRAFQLQRCHLILVDEAQSIPRNADTTWNRFFADVNTINNPGGDPRNNVRVVGATATEFRLDSGRLTEGKGRPFQKVIYDYSIVDAIEEGYLTQPVSRAGGVEIDTTGLHSRGGDFAANELEAVAVDPVTVEAIADEMVAAGQQRQGWILFGAGVKHCMMLRAALRRRGIDCEGVFATEPQSYNSPANGGGRAYNRDLFVTEFKAKRIKCLVSVSALAVGFNAKHVDLIGIARPTQSVGLYIQIVGRGTRPLYAPGWDLETKEGRLAAIQHGPKPNALVLDWGGNIRRHGLIDQPNVKKPSPGGTGDIPTKECKACGFPNFIAARECKSCGAPFEVEGAKLSTFSAGGAMLSMQLPPPAWIPVKAISYFSHTSKTPGNPNTLRVSYQSGINFYNEWVSLNQPRGSYARNKAESWWRSRARAEFADLPVPASVDEALTRTAQLKEPSQIQVRPSGKESKFFEVVRVGYE